MQRRFQWIIVIAILASSVGHAQWATARGEVSFPDGARIAVEIADTPALRSRGLMFRDNLPEGEGMVFLFEQTGFYPFWMQNCLIAIDMIWVDDQKRVVSVAHSVPPCRMEGCTPPCNSGNCPNYSPTGDAKYVVEVASGVAKKHQLKAGDRLVFKNIGAAKTAAMK